MEAIDVCEITYPVRNVHHNDEIDQDGEEFIGGEYFSSFSLTLPRPFEAGNSVAEAVELLQGCGELVELR